MEPVWLSATGRKDDKVQKKYSHLETNRHERRKMCLPIPTWKPINSKGGKKNDTCTKTSEGFNGVGQFGVVLNPTSKTQGCQFC